MRRITGTSHLECNTCHKVHRNVANILGPKAPDAWAAASPGERLEAELTPDICLLPHNGRIRHFLRGHLQLRVDDHDFGDFIWSVWVELDEASMMVVARTWSDPNRASIPALYGHLATELPYEQPTSGLLVAVHTRAPGEAPELILDPHTKHCLTEEQAGGIAVHRAVELAGRLKR